MMRSPTRVVVVLALATLLGSLALLVSASEPPAAPETTETVREAPIAEATPASAPEAPTRLGPPDEPVWDPELLASHQLPLYDPSVEVEFASRDIFYRLKPRPVYKTYPVYHPDHEPEGYWEWLQQQEPETVFDPSEYETEEDWIEAGRLVFYNGLSWDPNVFLPVIRNPDFWTVVDPPLAKDGSIPFYQYVVRKKGRVEVGYFGCNSCHTRVMEDGTVVDGAQGNMPHDEAVGFSLRQHTYLEALSRLFQYQMYGAPWIDDDRMAGLKEMTLEQIASMHEQIPAGVLARQGASLEHPVAISDLFHLEDRRYLDRTGLVRHESMHDLMLYAASNQDGDIWTSFDGFIPVTVFRGELLPPESYWRYTDAQLYALGMYLYSLEPPPNPHPFDELAARGQQIFESEGCSGCHVPPLYTNNKLNPVEGVEPPEDHYERFAVMERSVGTDPGLATMTRRGTGYYKVPSLRGVWLRSPLGHSGSVATLEDWLDPARLDDDYVPTGFRGLDRERGPVPGHRFGLRLSPEDKEALIAFLRTL